LEGTLSSFGEYDECLDIKSLPYPDDKSYIIKGRYCLVKPIIPYPAAYTYNISEPVIVDGERFDTIYNLIDALNLFNGSILRNGICIPSKCNANEFQQLLNECK